MLAHDGGYLHLVRACDLVSHIVVPPGDRLHRPGHVAAPQGDGVGLPHPLGQVVVLVLLVTPPDEADVPVAHQPGHGVVGVDQELHVHLPADHHVLDLLRDQAVYVQPGGPAFGLDDDALDGKADYLLDTSIEEVQVPAVQEHHAVLAVGALDHRAVLQPEVVIHELARDAAFRADLELDHVGLLPLLRRRGPLAIP